MNTERLIRYTAVVLFLCVLAMLALPAQAQTRSTPCDPATPANAACIMWAAVTSRVDGTTYPAGTVVSYRVEKQSGTAWTAVSTITQTRYLAGNLAYGTHTFRVIAVVGGLESDPSNTGVRQYAEPVPRAPVITIAVVIGMNHAPVYRITQAGKRDQRYTDACGYIEVGKACEGPVVYRFRDRSFRRVATSDVKAWGVSCGEFAVAPCG